MIVYTYIKWQWDGHQYVAVHSKWHEYDGPVQLLCGATDSQKLIEQGQQSFFETARQQAQTVFGDSSAVFKDLINTFSPIVEAGPNQRGFSDAERANLNTQVTEGTANAYNKAAGAVNAQIASRGGGNEYIPSGADDQRRQEVATEAARQESSQKLAVSQADYATGRENYFTAAKDLAAAPSVFAPAEGFDNATTNAGNAAATSANQIAQEDNSWVDATIGALGSVAGATLTGGMSNLGKGTGFFG